VICCPHFRAGKLRSQYSRINNDLVQSHESLPFMILSASPAKVKHRPLYESVTLLGDIP
jgi:hypothetical protein